MKGEVVKYPPEGKHLKPRKGSAGLNTQLCGAMSSVSNLACATGGISSGNLVKTDSK